MNSDFLQSAGCCDNHQVSKFLFTAQKQVDPFYSIRSAHPKERHAFINLLRPCLSHAVLTDRGNLHMHMGKAVASLPAAKMLIPNHKT